MTSPVLNSVVAIEVLGNFRCIVSAQRDAVLRPSSQRLVALLAVYGPQPRRDVAGILWPDTTSRQALNNLRTILWRLRSEAGGLVHEESTVCKLGNVAVDLRSVHGWITQIVRGELSEIPAQATRALLPTWDEPWLVNPREELRLQQLHGLEAAAQLYLHHGRLAEASQCARAAVTMDPLRESANRILLEVSLREGNDVEAFRQFKRFETLLRQEMGIRPGPGISVLMAAIRQRRDPS
jgi:DNA-binding SARP family transcriptional activator